jgi:DNA-binding IclR family transcriptional regulator
MSTSFVAAIPVSKASSRGSYQLHSLDRAVAVLEMLSESNAPLSLSEICGRLRLHKTTAHRSLMVLERSALIERTCENRFRLGLRLYELGYRAVEQIDLFSRINPLVRRLAAAVGETVHVGVLQKTSIVYLDRFESNRKGCRISGIGASNPVYCTALGKAMLAFQPPEVLERIVSEIRFVRYTEKTITSKVALLNALEGVRRRGYAIDDEEIVAGVRCVGAPILDENDRAIAAVSVSGFRSHITVQRVPGIAQRVLRCARAMGQSLGVREKKKKPRILSPFEAAE